MIKLENLKLSDILPERLKTKEILAVVAALDEQMKEITTSIDDVIMLPHIDQMPEEIVDSLAWQFHVDFYEPLGLNIDLKRTLVKNSLLWHSRKGTKYALVEIIRVLFLDDFDIEEWFEYGGRPYFFRLVARHNVQSLEKYNDLVRAIFELKNERSWLDAIRIEREAGGTIHIGNATKHTRKYPVDGDRPILKVKPSMLYVGSTGKHLQKHEVGGYRPTLKVKPSMLYVGSTGKHLQKHEVDAHRPILTVKSSVICVGNVGKYTRKYVIDSADPIPKIPPSIVHIGTAGRYTRKYVI